MEFKPIYKQYHFDLVVNGEVTVPADEMNGLVQYFSKGSFWSWSYEPVLNEDYEAEAFKLQLIPRIK